MRLLHLFLLVVFCSITSAWPHPDEILETFPDLGSIFDIFGLPTAAELAFAQAEPADDLGSIFDISSLPTAAELAFAQAEPAECPVEENPVELPDSDTIEDSLFGLAENLPLDTDLFSDLDIMKTTRTAPPCGPEGTHYRLCCFGLWGAPGFVSKCQSDEPQSCIGGSRFCCQEYEDMTGNALWCEQI